MAGYTKLFGSILDSSVWREPPLTRLVWLTLLAMADRDGIVEASVVGIADRARVSEEATQEALACFLDVDPRSKNPANDGRRIERVPEGYRLLNYEFYRAKMSAEEMRAKNADRQRRYRERQASVTGDVTSRPVTTVPGSNGSEAESDQKQKAKAEAKAEKREKAPAAPPAAPPNLVAIFCEEYKAAHGRPYQVSPADAGQGMTLRKAGTDPEAWRAMCKRYVISAKPFYANSAWPMRLLATNLNEFSVDAPSGAAPRDIRVGHVMAEVKPRPSGKVNL